MENLLFYDIEVYKYDAFVVFKDINKNTLRIFHNDFEELRDFIKGKTLVGYNNYFYDDLVLTKMIRGWSNYQLKEFNVCLYIFTYTEIIYHLKTRKYR